MAMVMWMVAPTGGLTALVGWAANPYSGAKSVGLVQQLIATWHWVYTHHQMNNVNSGYGLPWGQHHKHQPGLLLLLLYNTDTKVHSKIYDKFDEIYDNISAKFLSPLVDSCIQSAARSVVNNLDCLVHAELVS